MEPSLSLSAATWLSRLSSSSKISLVTDTGSPYISDLKFRKSKLDIHQYLNDRDDYRAAARKPRIWSGANIALHHKLLGRSNKVGDRVITQRIGLIKKWQWHSSRPDNKCQSCGDVASGIDHPLRLCRAQCMIDARAHWWNDVEHYISKSPLHLQQDLYTIARHARETTGGEAACCGTFLPIFVNDLPMKDCSVDELEGKRILKLLRVISGGCRRLLRLAAECQLGPLGVNLRQYTIAEFYKPTTAVAPKSTIGHGASKPRKIKNITYLNKNLSPHDIFSNTPSLTFNDILYWEFKAG